VLYLQKIRGNSSTSLYLRRCPGSVRAFSAIFVVTSGPFAAGDSETMKLLRAIHSIGRLTDDDETTITRKKFLDFEALGTSIGFTLLGGLLFLVSTYAAFVTLAFFPITVINYTLYYRFKNFFITKHFQTLIHITNALIVQALLGGFEASGGYMVWSLVAMIVVLPFHDIKESIVWSVIYVFLCGLTFWLDPYFQKQFGGILSTNETTVLRIVNVMVVFSQILFLYIQFIRLNFQNTEQVRQTFKQLMLSEKLAGIGQLSAGIAHEVNTPLGAIKSSAEESLLAFQEMLAELLWMIKTFNEEEKDLFVEFIATSNPSTLTLSTKEEREIKKTMRIRFAELGVENSNFLCDQLVQIGIHEVGPTLEKLAKLPAFDRLVRLAYNILNQRRSSQTIQLAVEKASNVVRALKTYLHTSGSESMEPINVRDNLEMVLAIYHNRLKHGIEVIKNYEAAPEIFGYPDQLYQVWTNLIVNAVQAMDGKGTLTIGLKTEAAAVLVTIQDTGKGIPEAIKSKIFDPFFTTKAAGEGSGLGLDIIKRILDHHEATIKFESTEGIGTTFLIRFPIRKTS
jgi:signal transduction histidine kinase